MVPKTLYPQPLIQLRTLVTLLAFKSNGKKSEALLIMSLVGNRENLCPKKNIKWPENRMKFIGAWISTDLTCIQKFNCRKVEQKNTGDYQKDEIS